MIATEEYVKQIGNELSVQIPLIANKSDSYRTWTEAVFGALKLHCELRGWRVYPEDRVFKGEYLCDFTAFEKGYGCRLACESQWWHWTGIHQAELNWAFEKLRGVKSDLKLFICEATKDQLAITLSEYLMDYAQLSTDESFLILRFDKDRFEKSWWRPDQSGLQNKQPQFEEF